jgi:hypothetical protein
MSHRPAACARLHCVKAALPIAAPVAKSAFKPQFFWAFFQGVSERQPVFNPHRKVSASGMPDDGNAVEIEASRRRPNRFSVCSERRQPSATSSSSTSQLRAESGDSVHPGPDDPTRPTVNRDTIFVSHANPEDNTFALWLALRLEELGFKVWCELTNLPYGAYR